MAKRKRRKQESRRPRKRVETARYEDGEGNVLSLRKALSPATVAKLAEPPSSAAATIEDAHHRREEMLFERLVVSWEIAGLEPLSDQKLLLGRFRMASPAERRWIRESIAEHVGIWIPGVDPPTSERDMGAKQARRGVFSIRCCESRILGWPR